MEERSIRSYWLIFLVLFISTQTCLGFPDTNFNSFSIHETQFGKSEVLHVHVLKNLVEVTINETVQVPIEIIADNIFVNIYFSSDSEISQISNLTDVEIKLHPQVFNIHIHGLELGHCILHVFVAPSNNSMQIVEDYVTVNVHHSDLLDYLIDIVGWLYFVAWAISFYPQIFLNYKRKSVVGLHFDFLCLNVIGFALYGIFNIGLYWVPAIQKEYFQNHPYGVNPVQLNDVIFSLHAVFACIVLVVQCFIFERGDQEISKTGRSISLGILGSSCVAMILSSSNILSWLEFLYILSYMKLFITLIKYIPQAYFNYIRKSTYGWSIANILLDFTGGTLSILQMILLSYNYNDWASIFGDPTKFGLGLVSIGFDIFFMVQHYILYNNYQIYNSLQGSYMNEGPTESGSFASQVSNSLGYGSV